MRNLLIFLLVLICCREVFAQQEFRFRYYPVPEKVCYCSDSVMNQYQQKIVIAIDEAVLYRRTIKPPQERNQVYIQHVSQQIKKAITESTVLKKAAINDYRNKIEEMHFRLATADEKEKLRLKKKISKQLERYCKKYSRKQIKILHKQIKEMKLLSPWFSEMITFQNDYLPREKRLSVTDFDLYLLYLESLGKVYDFRMQPSERRTK